jgi:Polyketide cyclase / dehydrase and lipid transport
MTVHGLHREASIEIQASPEAVYDLVSDLPRMGEWSPENIGGEWQGGVCRLQGTSRFASVFGP